MLFALFCRFSGAKWGERHFPVRLSCRATVGSRDICLSYHAGCVFCHVERPQGVETSVNRCVTRFAVRTTAARGAGAWGYAPLPRGGPDYIYRSTICLWFCGQGIGRGRAIKVERNRLIIRLL